MDIYKTPIFKTICGDMLTTGPVTMTIRAVELEKVTGPNGTIEKPVIYFEKSNRPLVLNVTNSKKLAKALGRETNEWRGAQVELFAEEIKAFGELQNAVRLRVIAKPAKLTKAEHKARQAENTGLLRGQDEGAIGDEPEQIRPVADGQPQQEEIDF